MTRPLSHWRETALTGHHLLHARKASMGRLPSPTNKKPSGHNLFPKGFRSPDKLGPNLFLSFFHISAYFQPGVQCREITFSPTFRFLLGNICSLHFPISIVKYLSRTKVMRFQRGRRGHIFICHFILDPGPSETGAEVCSMDRRLAKTVQKMLNDI